jgi:hypothetical protein
MIRSLAIVTHGYRAYWASYLTFAPARTRLRGACAAYSITLCTRFLGSRELFR